MQQEFPPPEDFESLLGDYLQGPDAEAFMADKNDGEPVGQAVRNKPFIPLYERHNIYEAINLRKSGRLEESYALTEGILKDDDLKDRVRVIVYSNLTSTSFRFFETSKEVDAKDKWAKKTYEWCDKTLALRRQATNDLQVFFPVLLSGYVRLDHGNMQDTREEQLEVAAKGYEDLLSIQDIASGIRDQDAASYYAVRSLFSGRVAHLLPVNKKTLWDRRWYEDSVKAAELAGKTGNNKRKLFFLFSSARAADEMRHSEPDPEKKLELLTYAYDTALEVLREGKFLQTDFRDKANLSTMILNHAVDAEGLDEVGKALTRIYHATELSKLAEEKGHRDFAAEILQYAVRKIKRFSQADLDTDASLKEAVSDLYLRVEYFQKPAIEPETKWKALPTEEQIEELKSKYNDAMEKADKEAKEGNAKGSGNLLVKASEICSKISLSDPSDKGEWDDKAYELAIKAGDLFISSGYMVRALKSYTWARSMSRRLSRSAPTEIEKDVWFDRNIDAHDKVSQISVHFSQDEDSGEPI